jgi:hypothetical protein
MIVDVKLSEEDVRTLRLILEQELRNLRPEYRRTHNVSFKDEVRQHMDTISRVLHAIEQVGEGSQAGQYVST